jgi:hypothetical protein
MPAQARGYRIAAGLNLPLGLPCLPAAAIQA